MSSDLPRQKRGCSCSISIWLQRVSCRCREFAFTFVTWKHDSKDKDFNLGTLGWNDTSAAPVSDLFRGGISLGLLFLRRFRLTRTVEGNRLANKRLEGGLVNFFSFVNVDRAARVSVETRVEETGRIL
jgi:hypothetical protein